LQLATQVRELAPADPFRRKFRHSCEDELARLHRDADFIILKRVHECALAWKDTHQSARLQQAERLSYGAAAYAKPRREVDRAQVIAGPQLPTNDHAANSAGDVGGSESTLIRFL
jgi:hypothetical protein